MYTAHETYKRSSQEDRLSRHCLKLSLGFCDAWRLRPWWKLVFQWRGAQIWAVTYTKGKAQSCTRRKLKSTWCEHISSNIQLLCYASAHHICWWMQPHALKNCSLKVMQFTAIHKGQDHLYAQQNLTICVRKGVSAERLQAHDLLQAFFWLTTLQANVKRLVCHKAILHAETR